MTPQKPDHSSLAGRATAEVHDLHVILQAWFRGEGENNANLVLSRFDEGFRMVGATGAVLGYADMAAGLPKMWASRPSLVMEISELAVQHVDDHTAVVVYRETQRQDDGVTQRWASAVFLDRSGNGTPAWFNLQETWCAISSVA